MSKSIKTGKVKNFHFKAFKNLCIMHRLVCIMLDDL